MIFKKTLLVFTLLLVVTAIGCKEKGPFEKAGEKVDNAADNVADAADEATEDLDDNN